MRFNEKIAKTGRASIMFFFLPTLLVVPLTVAGAGIGFACGSLKMISIEEERLMACDSSENVC